MRLSSPLLLVGLVVALATPAWGAEREIEGSWSGVLAGKLHVVVSFTKGGNGEYSGTLNSVDQHATLPLSKVTVQESKVRFETPSVGGAFEGTLNADGSEISGAWTQKAAPMPQPLTLRRVVEAAPAESGPATKPMTVPLDIHASISPTAFRSKGGLNLVYELHVTNMSRWNAVVTKVEISADDREHFLPAASWSGGQVEQIATPTGHPDATKKAQIGPGESSVLWLWYGGAQTGIDEKKVPKRLLHRIHLKLGTLAEELVVEGVPVEVSSTQPVELGAPLQGDHWVAANGPSNSSAHRRALIPVNGQAKIAQRFAIDWVRQYPDGKTYQGDPKENRSYRAYGAEVRAVANGTVTAVKDGIPENVPGDNSRAVPITLETIGGNHIIIDLGKGRYAFYAHLQPGSLKVKVGDKVKRGQVLALLGNSGNSTEPHLHFHVADANAPLDAEGIPYVFDRYESMGSASGDKKESPQTFVRSLPEENEVVRFLTTP